MSELHPLARAVTHPSPSKGDLPAWRIMAGIALAPLAFSLQVIASYVVAAIGCTLSTAPNIPLVAINLFALAATITGMGVATANFRATRGEKRGGHKHVQEIGEGRTRFLAYCGLCASAIFGLAVIVQLTAIITISACVGFPSFN